MENETNRKKEVKGGIKKKGNARKTPLFPYTPPFFFFQRNVIYILWTNR